MTNLRDEEVKSVKKYSVAMAAITALSATVPTLVAVSAFAVYVTTGHSIDGVKAFVTLNYISILRMPLTIFPFVISNMVTASVSLKRINKFLNNGELEEEMIKHEPSGTESISLKNASFHWGGDETNVLENIDIVVHKGSLTAVTILYL